MSVIFCASANIHSDKSLYSLITRTKVGFKPSILLFTENSLFLSSKNVHELSQLKYDKLQLNEFNSSLLPSVNKCSIKNSCQCTIFTLRCIPGGESLLIWQAQFPHVMWKLSPGKLPVPRT